MPTWSYDPSLAAGGGKDAVRLLIGDTDPTDQLLYDEEIVFCLGQETTLHRAASKAATLVAAKLSRGVFVSDGGSSVAAAQRTEAYRKLAADLLESDGRNAAPLLYVGGISVAEIESRRCDPDRPADSFAVGMHDHP